MATNITILFAVLVIVIGTFSIPGMGQSAVDPRIKDYLNRYDILDLIQRYGQVRVSFKIKGTEQKVIEKRPYNVDEGFRVQVFAGGDSQNAENFARKVQSLQIDSVYVIQKSERIIKVQVGNCVTREEAHVLLDKLYYAGIEGGWIVASEIHTLKEEIKRVEPDSSLDAGQAYYFGIQVFTTGYLDKAKQFEKDLKTRFSEPIKVVQSDNLWKIVIGRYKERQKAEGILQEIKDQGFADAWITQVLD
jgi:cell division septation protein DedD